MKTVADLINRLQVERPSTAVEFIVIDKETGKIVTMDITSKHAKPIINVIKMMNK